MALLKYYEISCNRYINLQRHSFLVGLKQAFKDIGELYFKQPNEVVAEELLNRLSKKELHLRTRFKKNTGVRLSENLENFSVILMMMKTL